MWPPEPKRLPTPNGPGSPSKKGNPQCSQQTVTAPELFNTCAPPFQCGWDATQTRTKNKGRTGQAKDPRHECGFSKLVRT